MKTTIEMDIQKIKYTAKKLKIATHPIRVEIIESILENKEMNVTQIYQKLNLNQPETSLHLGLMRQFGILNKVRRGKMSIYTVNEDDLNYILKISNELSKI